MPMHDQLKLTLIRHAKSSWQFEGMDDFHRPLNHRGLADALWMPAQVRERIDTPQAVYCSAAVRAVQTCQAVCEEYALRPDSVVVDRALYLACAQDILLYLANHARDARCVFVIAHNPGLTDLFNHLAEQPVANLPTFAVAHLHLPIADWSAASAHCARVEHLLLPKELRSK
jgi:phosphohistidine phosphatase